MLLGAFTRLGVAEQRSGKENAIGYCRDKCDSAERRVLVTRIVGTGKEKNIICSKN